MKGCTFFVPFFSSLISLFSSAGGSASSLGPGISFARLPVLRMRRKTSWRSTAPSTVTFWASKSTLEVVTPAHHNNFCPKSQIPLHREERTHDHTSSFIKNTCWTKFQTDSCLTSKREQEDFISQEQVLDDFLDPCVLTDAEHPRGEKSLAIF